MPEKTISKHLLNLEKQFAANNPALQEATKVFHDLDQLEFDLGLLEADETTARKHSWWPMISLISDETAAKVTFLNQFLGDAGGAANVHSASHKFTVFQYSPQATLVTLPGSALDADHRLPFYQISHRIEHISAGEGSKINAYLELKTLNSNRLKNRLFIETPDFNTIAQHPVRQLLNEHVIELSDLALVFTSVFETESVTRDKLIESIIQHQDTNKFIYIIDHLDIPLTAERNQASIVSWRKKLSELGINIGQFIVLANTMGLLQNKALVDIDARLANIDTDRSYRVLNNLEQNIRDIDAVILPEVGSAIERWKERCIFSTLIVLGFFISLMLFAEVSTGGFMLEILLDPIMGPLTILGLFVVIVPLHVLMSKLHAKTFIKELHKRQKTLNLTENLAAMFEKSLTFWRIVLPINKPIGGSKKYRARIRNLTEHAKSLVQVLNDHFSDGNRYDADANV